METIIYQISTILGFLLALFTLFYPLFFFHKVHSLNLKVKLIVVFFWGLFFFIGSLLSVLGFLGLAKIVFYGLVGLSFLLLVLLGKSSLFFKN